MKNEFNFPWFLKLTSSLAVYHKYVREMNKISIQAAMPPRKRILKLNMLLMSLSEGLIEAERIFLDTTQFPFPLAQTHLYPREEYDAMGLNFFQYLN